jgi:hypothetical protein
MQTTVTVTPIAILAPLLSPDDDGGHEFEGPVSGVVVDVDTDGYREPVSPGSAAVPEIKERRTGRSVL